MHGNNKSIKDADYLRTIHDFFKVGIDVELNNLAEFETFAWFDSFSAVNFLITIGDLIGKEPDSLVFKRSMTPLEFLKKNNIARRPV
jgi:hypothetical protein